MDQEKFSRFQLIPNWVKNGFLGLLQPFFRISIALEVNPNMFTTIGFFISFLSAYFFATGALRVGGALFILSGIFDVIDGQVARATNRATKFGALYDSTLDRYAEVLIFFGIAYYFIREDLLFASIAACVALGGSIMVSYVRARAEGLGFSCKVGLMQRPERITILGITALIHEYVFIGGVVFVALLSNFTAIQRIYHIWVAENGKKSQKLENLNDWGT